MVEHDRDGLSTRYPWTTHYMPASSGSRRLPENKRVRGIARRGITARACTITRETTKNTSTKHLTFQVALPDRLGRILSSPRGRRRPGEVEKTRVALHDMERIVNGSDNDGPSKKPDDRDQLPSPAPSKTLSPNTSHHLRRW